MQIGLETYVKDLAITQLIKTPVGEKLQSAVDILENIQEQVGAIYKKKDELGMTSLKAITGIVFAILKKLAEGKDISELNQDDWKSIAQVACNYAIVADDQKYSLAVFNLYEQYILKSVEIIQNIVPADAVNVIKGLADELHRKAEMLLNNEISEEVYTEECLWISLEAMIKLIASTVFLSGNKELSEWLQALSIYAFEYGRMILYRKEQEIVNTYIENQYRLDKKLEEKYAVFLNELQKQMNQFSICIENAFVENFRECYMHSIQLALSVGVNENEILKTTEDIDDFFLK